VEIAILAFAGLCFFTFWASAETCTLSKRPLSDVSAANFVVNSGDNEALVISTYVSKPEQRQAVYDMLNREDISSPDMLKSFSKTFKQEKEAISDLPSNLMFVENALFEKKLNYIYVNQNENTFQELERSAQNFESYLVQFVARQGRTEFDTFRKFTLATVGVAAYLHSSDRSAFNDVEFANMNVGDSLLKASDESTPSEARLQELLGAFKDNLARRNLKRINKALKSGGYDKYSNEVVRKDILDRFSPHSRDKVASWVDLAIAERTKTQAVAKGVKAKSQLVETILSKQGKGLVFVPREQFRKVLASFKEACAR
jgi:hypothetical protein